MRSTETHAGVTGIVALHGGGVAIWAGGKRSSPCANCVFYEHCVQPATRKVVHNLCFMRCWTAGVFHKASAGEILEILDRTEARERT